MPRDLRTITTVYSYYFPEVRAAVDEVVGDYPHDVFLRSIDPGLDDFHEPIAERLVAHRRAEAPDLGAFAFRYPTAGAEEAIREYLSDLASRGVRSVLMWQGDYEGYREVARSRGIVTVEVPFGGDPRSHARGHWLLSNPSARDGNIVPDEAILAILQAGHEVFYDLSYLGSTRAHVFPLAHPGIAVAAISFSKPYGLFYYRIGFAFCRRPLPALYANKWFKNVFSLCVADKIMERIGPRDLWEKYASVQRAIVEEINRDHDLSLRASDALLLAHRPADPPPAPGNADLLARFRRAEGYRLCLTPYFQARERAGA